MKTFLGNKPHLITCSNLLHQERACVILPYLDLDKEVFADKTDKNRLTCTWKNMHRYSIIFQITNRNKYRDQMNNDFIMTK